MRQTAKTARRGLAAVTVAAAVVCVCAVPAFAESTTPVTLAIDEDQISVTVPSGIPFSVKGDGTFTPAAASTVKIANGSQFAIHVSNVKMETAADKNMNLVKSTAFNGTTTNTFWMKVQPGSGTALEMSDCTTAGKDITTGAEWNLAKDGEIELTTSGAIINTNITSTTETQVATVTWTVAAGSLS